MNKKIKNKIRITYYLTLLVIMISFLILPTINVYAVSAPTVVTNSISPIISTTSTICNEEVTATGGDAVTFWGTYYGTTTSYGLISTNSGTQSSPFSWSDNLTNLNSSTLYHYKAYAQNINGLAAGSDDVFLTLPDPPTNLTPSMSLTAIAFTWNNEITDGVAIPYTQIQYSTTGYPVDYTDGDTGVSWTTGVSGNIGGLTTGLLYYFSAFTKITESGITQYSTDSIRLTAIPADPPTVTTGTSTNHTNTSATGNGNITDLGGTITIARGICYSDTDNDPTISDNVSQEYGSFGTGLFSESLTGLSSATLYYNKAYAWNSSGIDYGAVDTFLTLPNAPVFLTATDGTNEVNLTWTNAYNGSGTTVYTQVQYSLLGYPTSYNLGTTGVSWTTDEYGTVTSLSNNTLYYFSFFSKAVHGGYTTYSTSYSMTTFTTYTPVAPTVDNGSSDVIPNPSYQDYDAATQFVLTAMPYIAGGLLFICAVWILRGG